MTRMWVEISRRVSDPAHAAVNTRVATLRCHNPSATVWYAIESETAVMTVAVEAALEVDGVLDDAVLVDAEEVGDDGNG